MEADIVAIVDTYNKDGFWIKRTVNDISVFIPEQTTPSITIMDSNLKNCEWFMTKKYMKKGEFDLLYPNQE